tara:strand:+ start:70 stop:375 length:306 start_codon:yes stop_codon:yes gene_type:complete
MKGHIVINKITKFKNYIIKLTGYKFKKSGKNPLGLKYSFVLIKDNKRILGYDNHESKPPHIHRSDKEYPYNFKDIETAIDDFYNDVKKIMKNNGDLNDDEN